MEVEIKKFDHFGRGIGKIDDKIVFVDKALPNEIVDIKVIKDKKNYCEGQCFKVIKSNLKRIKPICPYYDKCGGCSFLHADYNLEKEFKIKKAKELLGQCDKFYETKDLNYRNKVTLHVENGKVGLYEEKSHKVIPINYCYLLDNNINKVISDLNKIDLSNCDIKRITIKANGNKLLMHVTGNIDKLFTNTFTYIDTIIVNNKIIKGEGYLEEVINNKIFKITSDAFFQVNKEGLLNISSIILDYLKNKKINNALDLYSGTGLWGILISDVVKNVTAVEVNKEACDNALYNIKRNNIKNIKTINGKVEDYIDTFKNIDLVILDPPRSGLDKKTIEYLKRINAKYFIYISCDMYTLKRDLELLKDIYKIDKVNLVDMFKRTYHCESITILERR